METTIKIECETPEEVIRHLQEIIFEIKVRYKSGDFEGGSAVSFEDSNCYGSHQVSIIEEPF